MLFLFMRVPVTDVVVPYITPVSENDNQGLNCILPASEGSTPDVNIHLVNLQSTLVMESLFTVRTLESFV